MAAPKFDDTFGALILGVILAAMLHGVTWVQAVYYFTHQTDRWLLRCLVGTVVLVDTVHQVLAIHSGYTYCVTIWGDFEKLQTLEAVWSSLGCIILAGISALMVQSFMTLRVWKLSRGNVALTGLIILLVLAEFGAVSVFMGLACRAPAYASIANLWELSITVNALAAAGDVLLAATLCSLLHRSRTGYRRSDSMINRLILFSVNSGIVISLCALGSLISLLASRDSFWHMAFFTCIPRLYTNTLLASLNSRKLIAISGNLTKLTTLEGISFTQRVSTTMDTFAQADKMGPSSTIGAETTKTSSRLEI